VDTLLPGIGSTLLVLTGMWASHSYAWFQTMNWLVGADGPYLSPLPYVSHTVTHARASLDAQYLGALAVILERYAWWIGWQIHVHCHRELPLYPSSRSTKSTKFASLCLKLLHQLYLIAGPKTFL
jgi:hypothetical protein